MLALPLLDLERHLCGMFLRRAPSLFRVPTLSRRRLQHFIPCLLRDSLTLLGLGHWLPYSGAWLVEISQCLRLPSIFYEAHSLVKAFALLNFTLLPVIDLILAGTVIKRFVELLLRYSVYFLFWDIVGLAVLAELNVAWLSPPGGDLTLVVRAESRRGFSLLDLRRVFVQSLFCVLKESGHLFLDVVHSVVLHDEGVEVVVFLLVELEKSFLCVFVSHVIETLGDHVLNPDGQVLFHEIMEP